MGTILKFLPGEGFMPTMTIKNIPEDIYLRIKQSALEHGRSINNEVSTA